MSSSRWLLLVHQIPAKPDYLRVKVGRRLAKIGAVALKKTVYALPRTDAAREDFEWVRREIAGGGGDAMLIEAGVTAGVSDEEIEELFRRAREADYAALLADVRALAKSISRSKRGLSDEARRGLLAALVPIERRVEEIAAIDFFGAPSRETAHALVRELRARAEQPRDDRSVERSADARPVGRTWVTRAGVHVDRIASAWLVRRFVDPEATFKLVPPRGYVPEPGEIRFDMDDAEHTHEGDACTFEVLCRRFAIAEPGLRAIAEIVHDIDLKDRKFGRLETDGVATAIAGIALVHRADDAARIAAGSALFDALLAAFARRSSARESRR